MFAVGCIALGYGAMAQEIIDPEQYQKAIVESQLAIPADVTRKSLLKPFVFNDTTYPYVVQLIELRDPINKRYRILARFLHKRNGHEAGRSLSPPYGFHYTPDTKSCFIQDAQLTENSVAVSVYERPSNPDSLGYSQIWMEFKREPPFYSEERWGSSCSPVDIYGTPRP